MPSVNLLTNGIGDINQGGQLVPTGTVFSFAGSTAPTGWLLCDGSAYSQETYPALSAVLGSTYNTQVNPTTGANYTSPGAGNFRVPDYRGVFLRSSGQASGLDNVTIGGHQNPATKAPSSAFTVATTGNKNQFNSDQADHGHGTTSSASNSSYQIEVTGAGDNGLSWGGHVPRRGTQVTGYTYPFGANSTFPGQDHTHTVGGGKAAWNSANFSTAGTVSGGGDVETRPINKGVLYIIKI